MSTYLLLPLHYLRFGTEWMGWATGHIERLEDGETCLFRMVTVTRLGNNLGSVNGWVAVRFGSQLEDAVL